MAAGALYFPYMSVPPGPWLARALLYWDYVGAIIPTDLADREAELGPHMLDLIDHGLVREIDPGEHLRSVKIADAFLKQLEDGPAPESRGDPDSWPAVRVHLRKLGDVLAGALIRRGLAVRDTKSSWLRVQPEVADQFMSYLAGALCNHPDVDMQPITDSQDRLDKVQPETRGIGGRLIDTPVRQVVLERVLAGPEQELSAKDILGFKERHSDALTAFRTQMDQVVAELSTITDEPTRAARREVAAQALRGRADELAAKMRERGWFVPALLTVLGLTSGVAGSAAGADVASVSGLLAAVVAACNTARELRSATDAPIRYAALVQHELG